MANIGIIADVLSGQMPNGIRTYTKQLTKYLLQLDKINIYSFIYSDDKYGPLFRNLVKLPLVLRNRNLDIVHEPTHLGPFFYKENYRKVITIHDLSPLIIPDTRPNSYITWIRHKIGLPAILKKVDAIIAVSKNTKEDLIERFGIPENNIHIIYEAADDMYKPLSDIDRQRLKIKGPFILNVGTLEPRKNLITLIRVFSICKTMYKIEHKLVIIGRKGWKYENIFYLIKELKLQDEIIILQDIRDEELVYYYNTADIFIYPSLYEGFGLPVLEAMQCGCPVIVSNISSLPEITGDAGLLVSPLDTEGIAEAIVKILGNKELRYSMKQKGIEQAKKFSWEKTAKETIEVYETLLQI